MRKENMPQQQLTHNKSERNQHISIHEEMTQPHKVPVKDRKPVDRKLKSGNNK